MLVAKAGPFIQAELVADKTGVEGYGSGGALC